MELLPIADASAEDVNTTPETFVTGSPCESDASCAETLEVSSECERARCDLFSGLCVIDDLPNGMPCDDGDICTSNDTCASGACSPGVMISCDDGNGCTEDSCVATSGCTFLPKAGPCDDGDPCTSGDQCEAGGCVAGSTTECDDSNPCTEDSCKTGIGCVHQPTPGIDCDDQDACTLTSECSNSGVCNGSGQLDCDDQDNCTKDTCDPVSGCKSTPTSNPCDDNDPCTEYDVCSLGVCAGEPLNCDDNDPCTLDECAPEQGCTHTPFEGDCEDGNPCTEGDVCGPEGLCTGTPTDCEDNNPCTFTTCDLVAGCTTVELTGAACEDGDLCTVFDECGAGAVCIPGPAPTCDDGNVCTTDSCEPSVGCVFTNHEGACDDGNPCTENESCQQGFCVGDQTSCDDDNPCTTDGCIVTKGCVHSNHTDPCDDGSLCTHSDVCTDGSCVGEVVDCDDGNSCTEDTCDAATGCLNPLRPDESPCEDGDLCTVNDLCADGVCEAVGPLLQCQDDDDCTIDTCEPLTGCVYPPEPACLPPTAWPVINEIDYKQFGPDTSDFVELLIVGQGTAIMDLYSVELVDGAVSNLYDLIHLNQVPDLLVPGDRIIIGPPSIANVGYDGVYGIVVPGDFLQNGGVFGDALRIIRNGDELIDAVSYEMLVAGATEGAGHIGLDPEVLDQPHALGRCEDGADTDDNESDFQGMTPSPGLPNLCDN